ncbi:hypothetical protein D3C86_2181890 [compost metagenome]
MREPGELFHVNANGEGLHHHRGTKSAHAGVVQLFGAALVAHVALEVRHIGLALQTHQVVGKHRAH